MLIFKYFLIQSIFLRIPTLRVRIPSTRQQQQQQSFLYKNNKASSHQPLSLLGSALKIFKSFHKSTPISPIQNPYYENYYPKFESNRDNYGIDSRSILQGRNELETYGSNEENRALTGVYFFGDNNVQKQTTDFTASNTAVRINGISLDRPQYTFVENKEREGAKREGISPTTKMTNDNSTTTTNNRNTTTENPKITENSTKSSNDNSTKRTDDNSTTTTNDRKTTTRHEETNRIGADKMITKTKQHKKNQQDKNKKKQKNHHHSNNTNNKEIMKDENTSNASREHASKETPSDVNKLSNTTTTKPNNNSNTNTASGPQANTASNTSLSDTNVASNLTDNTPNTPSEKGSSKLAENKKNNNSNNTDLASKPPASSTSNKVTGYATNLVNNNTDILHYQTLEERRDNRTQQNHIDMINVKQINHNGNSQAEMDVENITIATTKGIVPPSTTSSDLTTSTPPHVVSANTSPAQNVPKEDNTSVSSSTKENVNKNEVSPATTQEGFRNQAATTSSNLGSSKNLLDKNNATSEKDEIKPAQTLIHIEIKHAPIRKAANGVSKDLTPNIRQNIEINSEDASELLLNLLKAKKTTSELKDDYDETSNKHTLDPRILDLMRLREERERELDQTIRKYFTDVNKSHSTTTKAISDDNDDEELFKNVETPVPMFSARDLRLLRRMVENSKNKKRSGLNNPASTLWEKMLELTAERKHFAQEKGRMVDRLASRKKLAEGDSTLAKAIMEKVNNVDKFSFENKPNPFLKLLKKQALNKLQNFYANTKNGLKNSRTDVDSITPNGGKHSIETKDKNNIKDSINENNNNNDKHKQGSRRQYVWNGATFVPMEDRSSPSSYLNTDQGLSEEAAYKWNGVSFIENLNEASSPPASYPDTNQITSSYQPTNQATVTPTISQSQTMSAQNVQNILSQWNNEQSNRLVPQQHAIEQSSSRSEPEKPVPAAAVPMNINTPLASGTPEAIYEKDPVDNQVLYYWDGASYKPVQNTEKLAPNTLKYKLTANGGFELSDRKTQELRHLDDMATKPSTPTTSSVPNLQNLESHIENILQVHYPTNERTTPSRSIPPQTPSPPSPAPLIPPTPPPSQPFNPYVPVKNNDNGEPSRVTTTTEQSNKTPEQSNKIPEQSNKTSEQSNKNTETEDFEKIVTNDLNIKQAINALTRLFTADDDTKQESLLPR